jgi:hypothetical protein
MPYLKPLLAKNPQIWIDTVRKAMKYKNLSAEDSGAHRKRNWLLFFLSP